MQLTPNFQLKEFFCRDGTPVPDEYIPNVIEVAKNLQVLRDYLKTPIIINSGYRTPAYNKKVGGVSNSQHLYGKAADIRSTKYTPAQVRSAILELIDRGEMRSGGLGWYDNFLHYDIGNPRQWDYRKHKV